MRTAPLIVFVLLSTATSAAPPSTEGAFLRAVEPRSWSFPRDHGRHDGFKTEWWYFTGNVRDAAGRPFGFQLTFFRSAFTPTPATRPSPWGMTDLYFAHAAVSDVNGQGFRYADRLARARAGYALASAESLDVTLKDWRCHQADAGICLTAADADLAIELLCKSGRGPILQGPGGVNLKGTNPGQASYYYSITRLPTTGTIGVHGQRFDVHGLTWMDHEFSSNALAPNQAGWDWLALSLADGNDYMIYRLRDKAGRADYLSGTRIDSTGTARFLSSADIQLRASNEWRSPASGAVYPQRWTLSISGSPSLLITTRIENQELQTPGSTDVTYYEGTVGVTDDHFKPIGQGYLEMTGYSAPLIR
jgi:predicted secreted hydrolase